MRTFMPRSGSRLVHYTDRMPLFSRYELEEQIDRIYQRQIGLPSGGSIVIDGTEALTAIDVNSGRATRGANQEETAYKTNLEAAREVARQLRLRDIGGLMVVDFIDMRSSKHQRAVEKAMRDAMKDDKARSSVGRLSDNGLLEINRQRLKKALQLRTYRPCPTCSGTGSIASPELVALNILRRIETRAVTGQLGGVRVELHPELADAIQNDRRQELAALEREFDIEVEIIAAAGLHRAEERIDWRPRAKTEPRPPVPAVSAADIGEAFGQRTQAQDGGEPEDSDEEPAAREPDAVNDTAPDKPKPRRRRRGGRKRKKSGSGDDTPAANGAADGDEPHPPEQASAPASGDHETAGAPGNGDDEAAPPVKKKRRRPRRSRKKSAQTGEPTPSNESSDASPPDAIQPEKDEPDPFSY
jgi:ribonuclease E